MSASNTLRQGGSLLALGAVMLLIGLMAGPTPGAGAQQALLDIARFHLRYVTTNVLDLIALAPLAGGLVVVARCLGRESARALPILAEAAILAASALLAIVLVSQTVVDPALADRNGMYGPLARPHDAEEGREGLTVIDGADLSAALRDDLQRNQWSIAQTVLDFERGLFGLALALFMSGVVCLAMALRFERPPGVGPRLTGLGAVLSGLAAVAGIGVLLDIDPRVGQLEAIASLATLPWLAWVGIRLRSARQLEMHSLPPTRT